MCFSLSGHARFGVVTLRELSVCASFSILQNLLLALGTDNPTYLPHVHAACMRVLATGIVTASGDTITAAAVADGTADLDDSAPLRCAV